MIAVDYENGVSSWASISYGVDDLLKIIDTKPRVVEDVTQVNEVIGSALKLRLKARRKGFKRFGRNARDFDIGQLLKSGQLSLERLELAISREDA